MASFFRSSTPKTVTGPNFFPVSSYNSGFGALDEKDTDWFCTANKGFQTETQTYYTTLDDGSIVMIQVIWSFLGLFLVPATSQMTFKIWNPQTKKLTWKSVNVSNFKQTGQDSQSDSFKITHAGGPTTEETYHIVADLDKTVQLDVTWTRPASAPGCKYGPGPNGGFSTFGHDRSEEKRHGFVMHRFHPLVYTSGTITIDGEKTSCQGNGMFVHAIQGGMRPNLIASRWNFGFFTTLTGEDDPELGSVRAIMMEFETTDDYGPDGKNSGRTKCNVGVVYSSKLDSAPLLCVGQTHAPMPAGEVYPVPNNDVAACQHLDVEKDHETGYLAPHGITFSWAGERVDNKAPAKADIKVADVWDGLLEKVDVLAEIPYVLRKGLAAVTGAKPFIFQYQTPGTMEVDLGDKKASVKGWLYSEASFISE